MHLYTKLWSTNLCTTFYLFIFSTQNNSKAQSGYKPFIGQKCSSWLTHLGQKCSSRLTHFALVYIKSRTEKEEILL